jgi:hypothetical protein
MLNVERGKRIFQRFHQLPLVKDNLRRKEPKVLRHRWQVYVLLILGLGTDYRLPIDQAYNRGIPRIEDLDECRAENISLVLGTFTPEHVIFHKHPRV